MQNLWFSLTLQLNICFQIEDISQAEVFLEYLNMTQGKGPNKRIQNLPTEAQLSLL